MKTDLIEESWELTNPSPRTAWLRAIMTPLAVLHRVGLWCYLLPYRLGMRQQHILPVCVISIGNLVSGGTGKTPTTLWLVRALRESGLRVVILSRGHGRTNESVDPVMIVSDLRAVRVDNPEWAGDEPLHLAKSLPGTPVIVARNRRDSGDVAIAQFQPDVIVLDDGMQYWQLHRDIEICLVDARQPFGNGWVLPRGPLREPVSHLSKADVVVLTRSDQASAESVATLAKDIKDRNTDTWVTQSSHVPVCWLSVDGQQGALDEMKGLSVLAVTAIADADQYFQTLRDLGLNLVREVKFPDHHSYTKDDIETLLTGPDVAAAHVVVTTEKDMVKLGHQWPKSAIPLAALRIETRPVDHDALIEAILDRIVRRNRGDIEV
ncbi:MAG: tetraacyldisaccharide 4'-kinase [Armatimonadaceae bacterium]